MIISIDNKDTNRFALIKGEKKNVKFTIQDENGDAKDCSSATLTFVSKSDKDGSADLTVADGSMDKTDAATGIVLVPVDTTGLTHATTYYSELKIAYSGTSVDHSGDILMTITQPVVT